MANLELQKQDYKPLTNSDFLVIINAKKINELPEQELRSALRYAMVKIGLRGANFPKGIEKSLLLDHVHKNFGGCTPDEIRIAFDWLIDDRLDIKDPNCYENFSCAYISSVMKSYLRLKNKVKQPKENLLENKPDVEQIEKEYQEFLNNPNSEKYFKR